MNLSGLFPTLLVAAITVGSLHSLAPDHWVPFAALGRAQGWSAARTARVTFLCGFGHVTTSVLLGLLGLLFGRQLFLSFGRRMESFAGVLLIAFGVVYAVWSLRRSAGKHFHGHAHAHYDHVHEPGRMTIRSLFLLFCADPCVAVVPLMFAAAPLGWPSRPWRLNPGRRLSLQATISSLSAFSRPCAMPICGCPRTWLWQALMICR